MQAKLEKDNTSVLINETEKSTGEIFYRKKGPSSQILMDLKTPGPQLILINEDTVTMYNPKIKQATQWQIGKGNDKKAEADLLQFPGLGTSNAQMERDYDVTLAGEEVFDGKNTAMLDLKPKTSSAFSLIRIWIDEQGHPVQFKLTEPSRDYAIFKFISPVYNNPLPDSKFDLRSIVPAGVKIQKLG